MILFAGIVLLHVNFYVLNALTFHCIKEGYYYHAIRSVLLLVHF